MLNWFKKNSPANGPDFSSVDTQAKVAKLFERGELEKLLLMPPEFGGEDNPLNTMYVQVGVIEFPLI